MTENELLSRLDKVYWALEDIQGTKCRIGNEKASIKVIKEIADILNKSHKIQKGIENIMHEIEFGVPFKEILYLGKDGPVFDEEDSDY